MVDDLQDDFVSYDIPQKDQEDKPVNKKFAMFIVVLTAWILFSGIFIGISLPRIKATFKQTDFINVIKNSRQYRKSTETVEVSLYFVNPKESEPVMEEVASVVTCTGESVFHDAVEGLLEGPSDSALRNGSLSFIEKGTMLLGLSVSCNAVFVDLSSEFLTSGSQWGEEGLEYAKMQIVNTIKAADPSVKDVVIIVDGSEI